MLRRKRQSHHSFKCDGRAFHWQIWGFIGCEIRGANLSGAMLSYTLLKKADLRGSDVSRGLSG